MYTLSCFYYFYTPRSIEYFVLFCMKLGHHKNAKVTEPDFRKKSLGSQMGENPYFGGIFDFFVYISASNNDLQRLEIWTGCTWYIVIRRSKIDFAKEFYKGWLISMIIFNLCGLCTFSTFAQKILKGWGWNFTWSFVKVMYT